jgi:hypothetical protein
MTHTARPAARAPRNAFLLRILVLVATGTGIPRQAVRGAAFAVAAAVGSWRCCRRFQYRRVVTRLRCAVKKRLAGNP